MSHRRSTSVALGVTAVLAAALTGCAPEDADNAAVCTDQALTRVDDSYCSEDYTDDGYNTRPHVGAFAWYFLPRGAGIPALGKKAIGGTATKPAAGSIRSGTSADGGSVTRGGFGSSSSGKSGG